MCPNSPDHRSRFRKPPYDPTRSDFPSAVLTLAILLRPSRNRGSLNAGTYAPLSISVCQQGWAWLLSSSHRWLAQPDRQVPRAPLPAGWCYHRRRGVARHVRERYPSVIAHTGSCVRPNPSLRLWIDLLRRVFAGCHQSLLGNGPSRRYLCNPYAGAWTPTPWCPAGACARFFPADDGLTSGLTRSAHQSSLQCNFNRAYLSRLQSVRDVQAPAFARPPECTHR